MRGRERWCAQPHTLPHEPHAAAYAAAHSGESAGALMPHAHAHAASEPHAHSSDADGDKESSFSDVYLNGLLPSSYFLGPERLQRLQMGAIGYTGVVRDVSCRRCTKRLGKYLERLLLIP